MMHRFLMFTLMRMGLHPAHAKLASGIFLICLALGGLLAFAILTASEGTQQ